MTADNRDRARTVIPRWRSWRTAEHVRELLPLAPSTWKAEDHDDLLSKRLRTFNAGPGPATAGELLSSVAVLGSDPDRAGEAMGAVRDSGCDAHLSPVAARLLEGEGLTWMHSPEPDTDVPHLRRRIATLKQIVAREPLNAVRWADLSRAYAVLGQIDHAARAMKIAMSVSKPNRFILRAAARFEIYQNDFQRGWDILSTSPATRSDPWLAAAELATASLAGGVSRNVRSARRLLDSGWYSDWHMSELAAALATLELSDGRDRKARQLMRRALVDPTENAVAQAEWNAQFGADLVEDRALGISLGFEARARRAWRTHEWVEAVTEGLDWQADQPFAESPAVFTSYVASVILEDYHSALTAARIGLTANPRSPMLANNMAFALANLDRANEAKAIVGRVSLRDLDVRGIAVVRATEGLIAFRKNELGEGRRHYQLAVDSLVRSGHRETAAMAASYWAREEIRVGSEHRLNVVGRVAEMAKVVKSVDVDLLVERLMFMLDVRSQKANDRERGGDAR